MARARAAHKGVKSALKRKYGRTYKRSKKRVACKRQSSTAYRCSFSLRYRKKRLSGNVAVRLSPSGIKTKVTGR